MANLDRPMGLKPVRHLNGNPYNGKFRMYYKAADLAEAIFIGSPVKLAGSADTSGKYPTIQLAGAGGPIVGAVVGFSNTPYIAADVTNLNLKHSPTLTANYVAVADDPDLIFECQEDSSTTFTADSVGCNCDLTTETGSTTTGKSTVELDCSTETTTSTLEVRILRLVDREDNALGNYSKWEVMINVHAYGHGLGATGV
jgi:hypothetical protein